ncbi:hypothetical protein C8A03DRAFT_45628 [Achaetomium macrosporum]|uniref:Myb-like domain-containing protein n=1 Tax=Achaetomium macrosporum TaxID=79813 RepID=A0AAN7C8J9_9PEZI|nr:hypothetical protein C8A03DRAFT_45628 [Achaetomium macrosporum]
MDSEDSSSGHSARDTSRLKDSVAMVIRQLQPNQQPTRLQSEEIPESDDGEAVDDAKASHTNDDHAYNGSNVEDEFIKHEENENDSIDFDGIPSRRHSISSAGSQNSPSLASSKGDTAISDRHSLKEEPNNTQDDPTPSTPHRRESEPSRHQHLSELPFFSPYSTVPPTPTQPPSHHPSTHRHHHHNPYPRKRSRSLSADPAAAATPALLSRGLSPSRPFKRHKTATFNRAYLALLNDDILDAASHFTTTTTAAAAAAATSPDNNSSDQHNNDLAPSQVGLTHWSAAEKTLFFEALARLGADDARGIAARVRTKGEMEVRAYLALLRAEAAQREKGGRGVKERWVTPVEMPAAVELSQACCAALEEAADAVSLRQEAYEEEVERKRWGGGEHWLIGKGNWREVESEPPEGMEAILGLLKVGNWLWLSERVFMNAAVEEYNWASVAEEKPAVRATALEDFYAIALEITRRLVAATIFVAESRVRAKSKQDPRVRRRVRREDAEAAALSLGLPTNSRNFWAKCARRLRLDVYGDEDQDVPGWEGEREEPGPMSYDDVERALGLEVEERVEGDAASDEETEPSEDEGEFKDDLASLSGSDNGSIELGAGAQYDTEDDEPFSEDEAEKEAIQHEMNEILHHSALEYPEYFKARKALRKRIRAERAHEAYADALDAKASYHEEKRLWALLERKPPMELAKVEVPAEPPKLTKRTADDLVRGFARIPGDWKSKLEVVPSRWEMEYAVAQEEKKQQKANAAAAARAESDDEN